MRRWGRIVTAAMVLGAMSLPGLTAGPVEAATTSATQSTACDPVGQNETQLLLPPWGDQAGWANPNQYETILTADLDGDDIDELLGRNASGMEVWEWGTAFQPGPVMEPTADPPMVLTDLSAPGQWVPSDIPGFGVADVDGYWDPSLYTTFVAADLEDDGTDEIVWRSGEGLVVADWWNGAWSILEYPAGTLGPMADTVQPTGFDEVAYEPWWLDPYYPTITVGDVDGDQRDDIIGRGPAGVQSYSYASGTWTRLDSDGTMPDGTYGETIWQEPYYYETIRVADVTGDAADDLIARGPDGLVVWTLSGGAWTASSTQPGPGNWSDGAGWTNESWYSTIDTVDLDGDGTDDIVGRTEYGLDAWSYEGGTWTHLTATPTSGAPSVLSDADGFSGAPYYETIQGAELGPVSPTSPGLVLARSPSGVGFYQLSGGAFGPAVMAESTFSDANGWDSSASRYATITTATIASGTTLLFGRDATGLRSFQLQGSSPTGTWGSPSATFPAWSDPGVEAELPPPGYDATLWAQQVNSYNWIYERWQESDMADGQDTNIRDAMVPNDALIAGQFDNLPNFVKDLDPPVGQNIPQDVWDQVQWQTWSWLVQAQNLQFFLFQSSTSLQTLLTQGGIFEGINNPTDIASTYFAGKSQSVEAVVLDLMRNLIADASYVSDNGVVGGTALTMALTGSGLSTYAALSDPESTIATTAEDLDAALASAFCAAQSYLLTAYADAVADAGLLGAMGQLTTAGPLVWQLVTAPGEIAPPQPASAMDYSSVLTSYTDGQQLWTWQQLAAGNGAPDFTGGWRVGYCADSKLGPGPARLVENASCSSGFRDRVSAGYGTAWQIMDVCQQGTGDLCPYGNQYRVLNTTCEGSSNNSDSKNKGDMAWTALIAADIGFDPNTLFMPQMSRLRYLYNSESPGAYAGPVPIDKSGNAYNQSGQPVNNGLMGVLGWRVPATSCN